MMAALRRRLLSVAHGTRGANGDQLVDKRRRATPATATLFPRLFHCFSFLRVRFFFSAPASP